MKKVVKFLPLVGAVLGLVAVIALFLPVINLATGDKFPGVATVIGYDKKVEGSTIPMLGFSFMNLFTYLLAAAGIVCAVLTYLHKGGKYMAWIAAACLLVAGIFFFCVKGFATVEYPPLKSGWSLGYGAILAGISSILGACSLAATKLLNK